MAERTRGVSRTKEVLGKTSSLSSLAHLFPLFILTRALGGRGGRVLGTVCTPLFRGCLSLGLSLGLCLLTWSLEIGKAELTHGNLWVHREVFGRDWGLSLLTGRRLGDLIGELFELGDKEAIHVVGVRVESFGELQRWVKSSLTEPNQTKKKKE